MFQDAHSRTLTEHFIYVRTWGNMLNLWIARTVARKKSNEEDAEEEDNKADGCSREGAVDCRAAHA